MTALLALTACVAVLTPQGPSLPTAQAPTTLPVQVNTAGMIVGVPATGLHAIDGPAASLYAGCGDWAGFYFRDHTGPVSASASGLQPDWGRRTAVTPVAFDVQADRIQVDTRINNLRIRTSYKFDAKQPEVLVCVELKNLGDAPVSRIFMTREWQVGQRLGFSFPTDWAGMVDSPTDSVAQTIWMFDDLPAKATTSATFVLTWRAPNQGNGEDESTGLDVRLFTWTSPSFPTGLVFGGTNGVSWGDYDRDGWQDVFALQSARLWRNLGGTDFVLVGDYDDPVTGILPPTTWRYGSSFGDYDNDGLPDLPVEPRACCGGDTCFHLLHNRGGAVFQDVASPAATIISKPCGLDAETICWGDVDNDGDLDMFLPNYPPWVGSSGNKFWTNLGPTGPAGAYRFEETVVASGLYNPPNSARPEGAQMVDIDFDGDIDVYSNGHLYQNNSSHGVIDFDWMTESASGIGLATALDEGAVFFDYDLDGDYDLFVVYTGPGVRFWENRGDGTFTEGASNVIASPFIGLNLGMSAEDWDNDGDIDFTTRQVFRRNMLMETGSPGFEVASHNIPANWITSATPAWCDMDRDGDLDCALGNWLQVGRMMENAVYDENTPASDRRYVRVKAMRDSATVSAGLETEYGTSVEIQVVGETGLRRKKFVASSHGYLNQNEYALHFALPADPTPADPTTDLRFDVVVDFPTRSEEGLRRVDKHVNPALGNVPLQTLVDREIVVYRSGIVWLNGCQMQPNPHEEPNLLITGGGLQLPTGTSNTAALEPSPDTDHFVGLAFDTATALCPVRIVEVQLDGQLDTAVPGVHGPFNLALWDCTNPSQPQMVQNGPIATTTAPRNDRSHITVDWLLMPGRNYRVAARVTSLRPTSLPGPSAGSASTSPVHLQGGQSYQDFGPHNGLCATHSPIDPTTIYLAVRYRYTNVNEWVDLGGGPTTGAAVAAGGAPLALSATGDLTAGSTLQWQVQGAAPSASVFFLIGSGINPRPLLANWLVPENPILSQPFAASAAGAAQWSFVVPGTVTPGTGLAVQAWALDSAGALTVAASNALWISSR